MTGCNAVAGYTDACGSISGFPETVRAGEEVTFSVTINGGDCVDASTGPAFGYPRLVGSYIDRSSVLIDGAPPTRTFADGIFHYPFSPCQEGNPPRIDPVNGSDPGVALPLSGTHTVTLKISSAAPAECIHLVPNGTCEPNAVGPWMAIVGWNPDRRPQAWTHAQPFTITRRQSTQVFYTAATARVGEARVGETIRYTLTAIADPQNDALTLEAEIPAGTDLVPGSIDSGGQVDGNLVRWVFGGTAFQTVGFEVVVRSADAIPEVQTTVESTGRAISDIDNVSHRRILTLLRRWVDLSIQAQAPRPEGAKPRDRIHYVLTVGSSAGADAHTLTSTIREDLATIDAASITGGGSLAGGTITWNLPGSAQPQSVEFDATVNSSSEIPPTTLFITNQGAVDTTFSDGGTADDETNSSVRLLPSRLDVFLDTVTRRPGRVNPEETFEVQVEARLGEIADGIVVDATIPKGASLVDGSISDGGVKRGRKIRWTFAGRQDTPVLRYRLEVASGKKIKKISDLELAAHAEVTFASDDRVEADASQTLPIILLEVTGIVNDVRFVYPNANVVNVRVPLAGATVRLLDGAEVVSETTTDRKGRYVLGAGDDGTYTLEVRKRADQYSTASNSITTEARDVVQRREVTVTIPQDAPVEQDVILPWTLVNRAAVIFHGLNNIPIPLFSGAILTDLLKIFYDTEGASALVESTISAALPFEEVFTGSGPRDEWNGLIRMLGFMAVGETRARDCVRLADDVGKSLALVVTAEVLKRLGKKGFLPDTSDVGQLALQRIKIGTMVTVVGAALPIVLDLVGIGGQQKAQIIQIVATLLRFGADKWTGQFYDDIVFEIIFDVLRTATTAVIMGELFGSSTNASGVLPDGPITGRGGLQQLIDDVVDAASVRRYAGDTLQNFTAANNQNDELQASAARVRAIAASSLTVFSVFRGVNGLFGKGDKIEFRSGQEFTGNAKKAQRLFGKIVKVATPIAIVAIADAIAHPFAEIVIQRNGTAEMADVIFGLPTASALGPPTTRAAVADQPTDVTTAARAAEAVARRPKVPPSQVVLDYLDVMKDVSTALRRKDAAGVAALQAALATADAAALGDYLDGLFHAAEAALPAVGPADGGTLLAFLDSAVRTSSECGLFYLQLDFWLSDPATRSPGAAKSQVRKCRKALLRTDAEARDVAAIVGSAAAPAHLVITGEDLGGTHATGHAVTLSFTISNFGSIETPAGTIVLAAAPDVLTVLDAAEQPLPVLAPGASTTASWEVEVLGLSGRRLAPYQVTATAGEETAIFADLLNVSP